MFIKHGQAVLSLLSVVFVIEMKRDKIWEESSTPSMCCQLFCYPQVQFHGYGFRHVCGTSCRCITSPLVTAFALFRAHAAVITPFHCITVDILFLSILDVKCATLLLSCVLPPPLCIIVIVFNFFSFLSRHHMIWSGRFCAYPRSSLKEVGGRCCPMM